MALPLTPGEAPLSELFELEIAGEHIERRYRRMRPEVEGMPWGTLSLDAYPDEVILAARRAWTGAAFQEHRTGVACALTLKALLEARAPLDLIAVATRFPLDELVHVELCARLAMEIGGAVEIRHDPYQLVYEPPHDMSPLLRASELVVHNFCVGEALSIPLLRGTQRAADHPLPRAILARIVRDEAGHGTFGWSYLDWAGDRLSPADRVHLSRLAARSVRGVLRTWDSLRRRPRANATGAHTLGWMQTEAYLELAGRSLRNKVLKPLARYGIDPTPFLSEEAFEAAGLVSLPRPAGVAPAEL